MELAVYIGKARTIPESQLQPGQLQPTFKINSVFPVQGDGVTEVLADGTIANRGFPLKDLGDGNG